jgi:Zn-dependent peptidase ImmA (M78 family)/plasmid maintenance system antidote protein VapI
MIDDTPFSPDWVSPPGATIATILEERGVTPTELARWIERSTDDVVDMLVGRAEISDDVARRLASVLGASEAFWARRESQYRADLARLQQEAAMPESMGWLNEIPVKDIEGWGWLTPLANPTVAAAACLQFFGVPNVGAWREVYGDALAAAYRTSPTYKSEPGAVAAWIRQGEIAASSTECGLWDPYRFQRELSALRGLTREKAPGDFLPELVRRCAACGVAVVALRAPKLCRASGVVRFLSPTRPMILLSFRYLSDDQFWFTFFHEAGHLVLHGDRCIFLEGDDTLTTEEEDEANTFAANILIPPEYQAEMLRLPLHGRAVMRFARKVGISPGIIVGQLQHHGRFRRSQLNNLKRRYTWVDD